MIKIAKNRTIQAPADRVWEILADFGGVHIFHPLVESSRITNGQNIGLGAERRCDLYHGGVAIEEITSFDAELRHLGISVADGPGPFDAMKGWFTVTPLGDKSCEVRAEMEFNVKDGAEANDLKTMMEGAVESVLKGLDDHAVVGAIIGSGGQHLSTPAAMPA